MEHTHNHTEQNHVHHENETVSKMKGHAGALEAWLAPIFAKAPHLPANWRKTIIDIAPWLSLIFGILGLFGLLSAGAVGILFSPLIILGGGMHGISFFITIILGIISAILSILSFKPLQGMKKKGWDYAFYALVISAISTLVGLVLTAGGLGGIVGIIIGAYILFEVREMYH